MSINASIAVLAVNSTLAQKVSEQIDGCRLFDLPLSAAPNSADASITFGESVGVRAICARPDLFDPPQLGSFLAWGADIVLLVIDSSSGIDANTIQLAQEVAQRNPAAEKPLLLLMDGQLFLWEAGRHYLPQAGTVEILDLLHATPRIWDAAHIFYPRNAAQALTFVHERVLRLLQGDVLAVVARMRQMGTKRKLRGKKRDKLAKLCNYLQKNAHRMRYADYLAAGYPIASGVIEGARRHFVKDRLERSGMRWTLASAQAMLDLRSTSLNGDWEAFTQYRIDQETRRLYPHRQLVENSEELEWPLAA